MSHFRHAGDLGDIVYSLPTIRALGGGTLYIEAADYTRVPLTPDRWYGIDALISEQPYMTGGVHPWTRKAATCFNLNDFRAKMFPAVARNLEARSKSLADWMLETFQLDVAERDTAWIEVRDPIPEAEVIINRTGPGRPAHMMYHNPSFPWRRILDKYGKHAAFIGTELEHEVFCHCFGSIPYVKTADLHHAARVIAGSRLFVGNQSCCYAIAEGMKHPAILEVWPHGPNCLFYRPTVIHGWTHDFRLPDL